MSLFRVGAAWLLSCYSSVFPARSFSLGGSRRAGRDGSLLWAGPGGVKDVQREENTSFVFNETPFTFAPKSGTGARQSSGAKNDLLTFLRSSSANKLDPTKDKLVLFFSHGCPDCLFFKETWNKLPALLQSARVVMQSRNPDGPQPCDNGDGTEADAGLAALKTEVGAVLSSAPPRLNLESSPPGGSGTALSSAVTPQKTIVSAGPADAQARSNTVDLASEVELVAIEDGEYAAAAPFEHYEIPALFWVARGAAPRDASSDAPRPLRDAATATEKFPIGVMDAYLEHRSAEVSLAAEVLRFVVSAGFDQWSSRAADEVPAEGSQVGSAESVVLAASRVAGSCGGVEGGGVGVEIAKAGVAKDDAGFVAEVSAYLRGEGCVSSNLRDASTTRSSVGCGNTAGSHGTENSFSSETPFADTAAEPTAELVLGLLAEHPGQELALLNSAEMRALPVSKYILGEKRLVAEKHPEEVLDMVAGFFDSVGDN